jgi:murein DD-endopeptidase MepM/ murein hydrolase activator NlpD
VRNAVLGATYGPGVRRKADGTKKAHQGWDLYAREGTPAHAVADGVVAWTDNSSDYRLQLLLRFNRDGSTTSGAGTLFAFYAHLKDAAPKKGGVESGRPGQRRIEDRRHRRQRKRR